MRLLLAIEVLAQEMKLKQEKRELRPASPIEGFGSCLLVLLNNIRVVLLAMTSYSAFYYTSIALYA